MNRYMINDEIGWGSVRHRWLMLRIILTHKAILAVVIQNILVIIQVRLV